MKKFYFLLLSAVAFAFAGCATDPTADGGPEVGGEVSSKDSFYLDIAMSRPTTRSATDNGPEGSQGSTNSDEDPDYEYGYDYENSVNEVLLVFATTDDKFIFSATASNILESPSATPSENFQFTAKASVSKSIITDEYKENGLLKDSKMVRIYAFCNPTEEVITSIDNESNKGTTTWLDAVGSLTEVASDNKNPGSNNIWASRSFLMTNAKVKQAELPATEDAWSAYTNPDNPFHLSQNNEGGINNSTNGPIYVERTAARIDFSDASEGNDFTYGLVAGRGDVFEGDTKTEKDLNLINVELTDMALVNMSKGYYALRRVSADGTNASWVVGGVETPSNYVVDTDYSTKSTGYTAENAATGFNYTLFESNKTGEFYNYNMSNWVWDKLATVVANAEDTWSGSTTWNRKYHIWRYVTENTIPVINKQQVQQSVGVVFKGQIKPGEDIEAKSAVTNTQPEGEPTYSEGNRYISADVESALSSTTQNSPVLFSLSGLLYAGIKELTTTAVTNGYGSVAERVLGNWYLDAEAESLEQVTSGTFTYAETAPAAQEGHIIIQLTPAIYNYIKGYTQKQAEETLTPDWTTGFSVDSKLVETDADFKKLVTDQGVTMYAPTQDGDSWGYFCYYFYWNRHNDNGDINDMGVMEFATVRNNVYKLAVTKLSRLGHPQNPQDDPDPLEPGDEDETDDAYFDVQIVVMPWVVRLNDIEF
ncbi:MAG: Mfa1 fimbrilin C-terminal domain-containing protein [Alistipes sp.]|nr:Mfa1 fimbrilin C-terminal domain-containing protein [Alistipes sp.]